MSRLAQNAGAARSRQGLALAWAVSVAWLLAGCVDLTPPWDKGGAGGHAVAGGAGGLVPDAPVGSDDAYDNGAGGASGPGRGGSGGAIGGGGGAIDSRGTEAGAGVGGAGPSGMGGIGLDGSIVDVPPAGTGGAAGGADGGDDTPAAETGGGTGRGGAGGRGGGTGRGGAIGTGGASQAGGVSGSGGTSTLDGGRDLGPDLGGGSGVDVAPVVPPTAGLVVYYPCDHADGVDPTKLPDGSGNDRPGVLGMGPPADGGTAPSGPGHEFVVGRVGNAMRLHRAGYGHVKVPPEVFQGATDITIAYWVNVATSQSWQRMMDVGVTGGTYRYVNNSTGTKYLNMVPKNSGSNLLFSISVDGYSNEQTLSAPSLSTGTWTHLAVVLASGAGGRLYVNGEERNANASLSLRPADLGATIDYAFIGRSQFDADPPFDGTVDEFRVYHRALSAAEILALVQFSGP